MATVKENLIAAKGLIENPANWAKAGYVKPSEGRYCAAVACNDFQHPAEMFRALCDSLPTPGSLGKLFSFNDSPTTTHADIIALFDRAIAAQDGQP